MGTKFRAELFFVKNQNAKNTPTQNSIQFKITKITVDALDLFKTNQSKRLNMSEMTNKLMLGSFVIVILHFVMIFFSSWDDELTGNLILYVNYNHDKTSEHLSYNSPTYAEA